MGDPTVPFIGAGESPSERRAGDRSPPSHGGPDIFYFVSAWFFGLPQMQLFRHLHMPPCRSRISRRRVQSSLYLRITFCYGSSGTSSSGIRSSIADEESWGQGADPGAAVRYYRGRPRTPNNLSTTTAPTTSNQLFRGLGDAHFRRLPHVTAVTEERRVQLTYGTKGFRGRLSGTMEGMWRFGLASRRKTPTHRSPFALTD